MFRNLKGAIVPPHGHCARKHHWREHIYNLDAIRFLWSKNRLCIHVCSRTWRKCLHYVSVPLNVHLFHCKGLKDWWPGLFHCRTCEFYYNLLTHTLPVLFKMRRTWRILCVKIYMRLCQQITLVRNWLRVIQQNISSCRDFCRIGTTGTTLDTAREDYSTDVRGSPRIVTCRYRAIHNLLTTHHSNVNIRRCV